jgi:hypothetical protein
MHLYNNLKPSYAQDLPVRKHPGRGTHEVLNL